jgi:transcriptional regulator with XRE-family HTH domain
VDLSVLVSANVRGERARAGMSQAELEARSGIGRSTISDIEQGDRRVTVDDLLPLCRALGVGLRELFRDLSVEDLRALGL